MRAYSHNTGTFIGKGGTEIFFHHWCLDKAKGILVIAHGVGEHSGRYGNIISELQKKNISVYALDLRGHGRSGGKRGHADSFMDYVSDLKLFINIIQEENENPPILLLGHSMGGIIACKYALTYPDDIRGLVLSSPALIPSVDVPAWKKRIGVYFSKYLPKISMATGLDPKQLSHDPDVVDAYENDHLVHGLVSARWFTEFVTTWKECLNRAHELTLPLLVFHGKQDAIVDYRGSEKIYNNSSSPDKKLFLYEGLYHETMNELDNKKILQSIAQWIARTLESKKKIKPAKRTARNKPITTIEKKEYKKKFHTRAPLKKGVKKSSQKKLKKGVKKIVATKKSSKKGSKKAGKKSAKKTTKKK
jgi:acylglycerol lipase